MINMFPDEQFRDAYLFELYNRLGGDQLRVWYDFKGSDGEIAFSKWMYYKELLNYNYYDYVPDVKMTRQEFTNKICHRTTLPCEVLIDIDTMNIKDIEFDTYLEKAMYVYQTLKQEGKKPFIYHSGNKFHIHYLIPQLMKLHITQRILYKEMEIDRFGGEIGKSNPNAPIMFEFAKHRKTGLNKKLLNRGDYYGTL